MSAARCQFRRGNSRDKGTLLLRNPCHPWQGFFDDPPGHFGRENGPTREAEKRRFHLHPSALSRDRRRCRAKRSPASAATSRRGLAGAWIALARRSHPLPRRFDQRPGQVDVRLSLVIQLACSVVVQTARLPCRAVCGAPIGQKNDGWHTGSRRLHQNGKNRFERCLISLSLIHI